MAAKLSVKLFLFVIVLIVCLQSGCSDKSNSLFPGLNLPLDHVSQLPKGHNYLSLYFVNEFSGWVVGKGGVIYHTTNKGTNWILQNSYLMEDLVKVQFTDEKHGWIAGENNILSTSDAGVTWTSRLSGIPFSRFANISFIDNNTGWVSGTADGRIYHTSDAGVTWDIQLTDTLGRVIDLSFVNKSVGYSISNVRGMYKTLNGGQTWNRISQPRFSNAICFLDSKKGFAGNNVMPSSLAVDKCNIFITEDGGSTWVSETIPNAMAVWKLSFTNSGYGFAISGGLSSFSDIPTDWVECGALLFSPNVGQKWTSASTGSLLKYVVDFNFVNDNVTSVLTLNGELIFLKFHN